MCLGVPFTRNHAKCTEVSTLKSETENFEAVRSKIWLEQCAHHTIRKYNSIQPTGTGKRTCLPRSFVKGNYYFPDAIMASYPETSHVEFRATDIQTVSQWF